VNTFSSGRYDDELLNRVIPFWVEHSPDWDAGGFFSSLDRDGTVFDTDKHIWLQARAVWMFAHLYRTVESRSIWLEMADHGFRFLETFGRDSSGNWYFSLLRDGTPQIAPYNIFTDCFAAMACAEYAAVCRDIEVANRARAMAVDTFNLVQSRWSDPKGRWNKHMPGGREMRPLARYMITLNMAEVFMGTIGAQGLGLDQRGLDGLVEDSVTVILHDHLDSDRQVLFERIGSSGPDLDSMEGRLLNPGHALETLWMVIEAGERLSRNDWINQACTAIQWTLERGWDNQYGGFYYYQDYDNRPSEKLEYDMKLWWVHIEAIYALLLAQSHSKNSAYFSAWVKKVEQWTWSHFPDPEYGEWFGYLHRDGSPTTHQKGGKWKGFFHVPRTLLKCANLKRRLEAEAAAIHFLKEEQQFRLGDLVTEQSHPVTRSLSTTIQEHTTAGVALLGQVEADLMPVAQKVIGGDSWRALVDTIIAAVRGGKRIRFSGCGSTGRLAAILEFMWRRSWSEQSIDTKEKQKIIDAVAGIITGGDRALIKSVESFEDYQIFGRQQLHDIGIEEGDVCIAISEGGETFSVIGTAWEALDVGAHVFFVYSNPKDLLCQSIERSRKLIEDSRVVSLELTTGPMAITGSTRMQATSVALLVIGSAMDTAIRTILASDYQQSVVPVLASEYVEMYQQLVDQLFFGQTKNAMVTTIEMEENAYRHGGNVTYFAGEYLLDVFSDTTERTPTFNIPPLRSNNDSDQPESWAFPKHATLQTKDAWRSMLLREPRGLAWDEMTYHKMNAPERFSDNPPPLSNQFIYQYGIGYEGAESRLQHPSSVMIGFSIGEHDTAMVARGLENLVATFAPQNPIVHIGGCSSYAGSIPLSLSIPSTKVHLFEHLLVKLFFNTVSTATMARLGRVQGNYMIQVDPTNKKLVDRGSRIIADLANISYEEACIELHRTTALRPAQLKDRSKVAATIDRLV
jgi:mannose/cellobiose epimerase-like protein (N-acyl-D-glucosamine 2-epimerase family)/N-acetylmuramic acid 6-phosphate (MurNAc-6-P) etherase